MSKFVRVPNAAICRAIEGHGANARIPMRLTEIAHYHESKKKDFLFPVPVESASAAVLAVERLRELEAELVEVYLWQEELLVKVENRPYTHGPEYERGWRLFFEDAREKFETVRSHVIETVVGRKRLAEEQARGNQ